MTAISYTGVSSRTLQYSSVVALYNRIAQELLAHEPLAQESPLQRSLSTALALEALATRVSDSP